MEVTVVFKFDEVAPGSPEEDEIVNAILEESEVMRVAFDASGCWIQSVIFDAEEI